MSRPATLPRTPLTERILTLISDKGMSQRAARELAGIPEGTWSLRVRYGKWRWAELCDIATALGMRVDVLVAGFEREAA